MGRSAARVRDDCRLPRCPTMVNTRHQRYQDAKGRIGVEVAGYWTKWLMTGTTPLLTSQCWTCDSDNDDTGWRLPACETARGDRGCVTADTEQRVGGCLLV